jgi:hypothetical protein
LNLEKITIEKLINFHSRSPISLLGGNSTQLYSLPQHLTHLVIEDTDQPLYSLPQSLSHLTFGSSFNRAVDFLPKNISHLTFGTNFNQKVNHLPQFLTHLTFGLMFNQPLDQLPTSLLQLTFRVVGKSIQFPIQFQHELIHLPPSLTHLIFKSKINPHNVPYFGVIPSHINVEAIPQIPAVQLILKYNTINYS